MPETSFPFLFVAPGIGAGLPAPEGWYGTAQCSLLILVGLTGVGKTTTLATLRGQMPTLTLLPDRRMVTDRLIIPQMQVEEGQPFQPVADRLVRFAYTRRYRERFPGGMAHALSQIWIEPSIAPSWLIFDGLRGANEVTYAADLLPKARFVMLDAPDRVRVERLLGRNDAFDHTDRAAALALSQSDLPGDFSSMGLPDAESVFNREEERSLLSLVQMGKVAIDDLRAKVQIVVEERRNYDPEATHRALEAHAGERTLVLDTTRLTSMAAAKMIAMSLLDTG